MFGFGKKENLSINPDNHLEIPKQEGARIERGADNRSAREIGAELNRRAWESVKDAGNQLKESGKNLWGGMKRLWGSAKAGGREVVGQVGTWAKEGLKDTADLALGGAYKGGKAVARGVERGAAFVANAPEAALDKTADVLEAGSEWTKAKLEQGGQWANQKYAEFGGWAMENAGKIQERARVAKEAFGARVQRAVEWGKNARAMYQEGLRQAEIRRLSQELQDMGKRQAEMLKRLQELEGIHNLKNALETTA